MSSSSVHDMEFPPKILQSYYGLYEDGIPHDSGCMEWTSSLTYQQYSGRIAHNNCHNQGLYLFNEEKTRVFYDGLFYMNKLEGYGQAIYTNGDSFEGLFKGHSRFGPGVHTHQNDSEDVGLWNGSWLSRLAVTVEQDVVPQLARNQLGKVALLKFRSLVPILKETKDVAKQVLLNLGATPDILQQSDKLYSLDTRNPNSIFFNRKYYDDHFFGNNYSVIDVVVDEGVEDGDYCGKTISERLERINSLLGTVERRLESIKIQKDQFENDIDICKTCCQKEKKEGGSQEQLTTNAEQFQKFYPDMVAPMTDVQNRDLDLIHTLHTNLSDVKSPLNLQALNSAEYVGNYENLFRSPSKMRPAQRSTIILYKTVSQFSNETLLMFMQAQKDESIKMCCSDLIETLNSKLQALTDEEHFYNIVKENLFLKQEKEMKKITEGALLTEQITVTDLLAWNNEEIMKDMLRHSFQYVKTEENVSFSVSSLLAGDRDRFKVAGEYEMECVDFLQKCADGNYAEVMTSIASGKINPDLCDAQGNTGIMFAASTNKTDIMEMLINSGCKVDVVNDEGVTPLSMLLLRYIAVKKKVTNWEKAFLQDLYFKEEDLFEFIQWRPRAESQFNTGLLEGEETSIQFCKSLRVINNSIIKEIFAPQEDDDGQKYIFSLAYKKRSEPINEQHELKSRESLRLDIIKKNIILLLNFGTNPNVGEVPFPPLVLATFSEDPLLVEKLLLNKSNPNITIENNINPLHIIASLEPKLENVLICEQLLDFNADPNCKTGPQHWSEQKPELFGRGYNPANATDDGKNVLHLLAMREDFNSDCGKNFSSMAKLLVENDCSVREYYLGHTPLSLAVLRGNIPLIKTLIETNEVNPYQVLLNDMGNILTLHGLNRYNDYIPFELSKQVLDCLLSYNINPLNTIPRFDNVVHFLKVEQEDTPSAGGKKKKKDSKKSAKGKGKKSKDTKSKTSSKKSKEPKGKDKKSKSSKKKGSKSKSSKSKKSKKEKEEKKKPTVMVADYLKQKAREILINHIKTRAVEILYLLIAEGWKQFAVYEYLVKYVTREEAFNCLKLLFQNNRIKQSKLFKSTVIELLDSIKDGPDDFDYMDQIEQNCFCIKDFSSSKTYLAPPEVDDDLEKYEICFECLLKTGKSLHLCSKCELVYFCSHKCNDLSNKSKEHKCNYLFYNEKNDTKKMARFLGDTETGTMPLKASETGTTISIVKDLSEKIGEFKELQLKLSQSKSKIYQTKEQRIGIDKMEAKAVGIVLDIEKDVSCFEGQPEFEYLNKSFLLAQEEVKLDVKRRALMSTGHANDYFCHKHKRNYPKKKPEGQEKVEKSIDVPSGQERSSAMGKIVASASVVKSEGTDRRSTLTDSMSRSEAQSVVEGQELDIREKSKLFQKIYEKNYIQKLLAIDTLRAKHPLADDDQCDVALARKMTEQMKKYMTVLSKIFPDFNLPLLFLPYACIKEGQMYYKFADDRPIFSKTFHKLI